MVLNANGSTKNWEPHDGAPAAAFISQDILCWWQSEGHFRFVIYPGTEPELGRQLQHMLLEHNKYILDFKAIGVSIPNGQKDFQVVLNANKKPPGEHQCRFNAPTTREVVVFIVSEERYCSQQ